MSRPPRPLFRRSTTGDGSAFASRREFLPVEFGDMVELERQLAESEARLGVTEAEGDFAYTLMELSALAAQTLGLYQNLYAREAYLGTAETAKSLVLHARRLAYEPDQGLAASGYAILTVGKGLAGRLPSGFALSSSPRGEVKAQTFETLEDTEVDARRNEALPVARTRPASITFAGRRGAFRLAGTGLNLVAGEYAILVRDSDNTWEPATIIALTESPATDETTVEIELLEPSSPFVGATQQLAAGDGTPLFRLLATPKAALERFGRNADPVQFPPAQINAAGAYPADPVNTITGVGFGYTVTMDSGATTVAPQDIYLNSSIETNLLSTLVIARVSNAFKVRRVSAQGSASVAFRRGNKITFQVGSIDNNGDPVMQSQTQLLETAITGTVTYLRLETPANVTASRSSLPLQTPVWADWQFEADLLATEPNPEPAPAPLEVAADFGDFRPGAIAVFGTLDGVFHQVVEVQGLTITPGGTTLLSWVALTGEPPSGWTLDNLRVFGNVARITHGETVEEVLGGSDGITPFQKFELKKAPVTQVPGADGGEQAIVLRVNEVAWTRVDDFFASGPEDRHYRLETDENQKVSVIFGNGRNGAIPPSGRKHIRALYRQGLGAVGNVETGAASRIKKAHPLIDRAFNPTPILGGADPASLNDFERQATRYIRTFDRAVSIQDHADVALLYPGVARAAARLTGAGGIEVVVATTDGSPPVLADVEAYLNARRDSRLPMTVTAPDIVDLFLNLALQHDPAYLTENVKRAVQDALLGDDPGRPGLFTFAAREFGQAAHLSEVYDRVAEVEGVTFVDVTRFRIENQMGVKDVLRVNARQWLRLPAANLSLSITPGATQ
ncbi:MAG TPA: putative baseplate assembly protein [Blastocatellia bacterium]|nr:putative baseplate assembly protein [Blastocatellia bacterium]